MPSCGLRFFGKSLKSDELTRVPGLKLTYRPSARCADRSFNIQRLRGLLNNSCVNVVVVLQNRCHFSHRGFLMQVLGGFKAQSLCPG